MIESVTPAGEAECTCISVDAKDRMYITTGYTPTHNTVLGAYETACHLTGKYLSDPVAPGRLTQWPSFGQRYTKPNVAPATQAYAELARQNGLTPTQLALAFVRSRWFVASTIIGASSLAQLEETLPATQTPLSTEILAEIDAIHLRYTNPAP